MFYPNDVYDWFRGSCEKSLSYSEICYKKHDANMYSTVLFNVCNESYVIPQFEYRKNRIMFWFINVLFSTDVLFYLTSFEQQLLRYKQNEQKQSVHSLETLFVQ